MTVADSSGKGDLAQKVDYVWQRVPDRFQKREVFGDWCQFIGKAKPSGSYFLKVIICK